MTNAKRKPRWHVVLYAVAASDVLTISSSPILSHLLINRFQQSVETHEEWSDCNVAIVQFNALGSHVERAGT